MHWHYEPRSFRPLAREDAAGGLLYVVNDHLGTPREMLDEAGGLVWAAEYRLWGGMRRFEVAANDNIPERRSFNMLPMRSEYASMAAPLRQDTTTVFLLCPLRFQGQWQDDETGLTYNRFRHYDVIKSQYTSPDPIGIIGGFLSYGYSSSPCKWIDPFGLAKCCETVGVFLRKRKKSSVERP